MASIWNELKRRNVVKVAVTYAIIGWLLIEVSSVLLPTFEAPDWVLRVIVLLVAIGFVLALVLSWIYELTPEGIERADSLPTPGNDSQPASTKLNALMTGLLVVAVLFLVVDRYLGTADPDIEIAAVEATQEPTASATTAIVETRGDHPVIAVLPFENQSAAAENAEFFANGIHDDVLTQLVKISSLSVISRTSVQAYRDSTKNMREIGEELGATSLVEGRVQRAGDMVRINVQLIDAATDEHLWAEIYNRELTADNIFEIQADIATNIAAALEAELSPDEQQSIERVSTNSTEALELYWRARELLPNINMVPPASFHEYLDEAIAIDPEFALAHALKAADYAFSMLRADSPLSMATREALARGHAEIALDLDPRVGLAYFALGSIHRFKWHAIPALEAHRRALALSPNDFDILDDYARLLSFVGQHDEAIVRGQQAAKLSSSSSNLLFSINWRAGEADAARTVMREFLAKNPSGAYGYLQLALLEISQGKQTEAIAHLRSFDDLLRSEGRSILNGRLLAQAAYANGRVGNRDAAIVYFEAFEATEIDTNRERDAAVLAHLAIGDKSVALAELRLMAEDRTPRTEGPLSFLADNVYADPVLDEPEFAEVRSRLGYVDL